MNDTRLPLAAVCLWVAATAATAASSPPRQQLPPPTEAEIQLANEARARRLATLETELAASLATVRAFGHGDEFLAAMKKLSAAAGDSKWITIDDGFLPLVSVRRYVEWSEAAPDRHDPEAVDFDLPGHPGPVIVDLANQLHAHGVEFLCVTLPSRVALYPEVVPELAGVFAPLLAPGRAGDTKPDGKEAGGAKFGGMVEANTRFLQELVRRGVEVVDLAPAMVAARHVDGDDHDILYLRGNLHWTPRGAEVGARVVADRVRAQPWFRPGPWQEGRDFTVVPKPFTFKSDFNGQAPGAAAERGVANQLRPKTALPATLARWNGPITVLSDSFASFEDDRVVSFRVQLERFTSWPVDLIAPDGGAEVACREALARRDSPLQGKRVVIWLLQEPNLRLTPQYRPVAIVAK